MSGQETEVRVCHSLQMSTWLICDTRTASPILDLEILFFVDLILQGLIVSQRCVFTTYPYSQCCGYIEHKSTHSVPGFVFIPLITFFKLFLPSCLCSVSRAFCLSLAPVFFFFFRSMREHNCELFHTKAVIFILAVFQTFIFGCLQGQHICGKSELARNWCFPCENHHRLRKNSKVFSGQWNKKLVSSSCGCCFCFLLEGQRTNGPAPLSFIFFVCFCYRVFWISRPFAPITTLE